MPVQACCRSPSLYNPKEILYFMGTQKIFELAKEKHKIKRMKSQFKVGFPIKYNINPN